MHGMNPATPALKSTKIFFSSVSRLNSQTMRHMEAQKQLQELTDSISNSYKIQRFKVKERLLPGRELQ